MYFGKYIYNLRKSGRNICFKILCKRVSSKLTYIVEDCDKNIQMIEKEHIDDFYKEFYTFWCHDRKNHKKVAVHPLTTSLEKGTILICI